MFDFFCVLHFTLFVASLKFNLKETIKESPPSDVPTAFPVRGGGGSNRWGDSYYSGRRDGYDGR